MYTYLICYFKFGLRTNHHLYANLGKAALAITTAGY